MAIFYQEGRVIAATRRKTILLIDDEREIVDSVGSILQDHDFQVVTAGNGQEGLEKAEEEHPDLILLDIMMPRMDGFEFLAKLKKKSDFWNIPVIMVTARGETSSILHTQQLRASDYIIKPFTADELLSLLRRYI